MPDEDQKLKLVRDFNCPLDRVWEAWKNPEIFALWYGSPGTLEDVTIDFQVDGKWQATTVTADGTKYPQTGVYTNIEDSHHIRFNFLDPDNPDNPDYEIMDVVFEQTGPVTKMSFIQTGNLPPEVYATGLKAGWTGFFDKLAEVVK
jgi:uncharacterized protein YndB with AHSA1/START domain